MKWCVVCVSVCVCVCVCLSVYLSVCLSVFLFSLSLSLFWFFVLFCFSCKDGQWTRCPEKRTATQSLSRQSFRWSDRTAQGLAWALFTKINTWVRFDNSIIYPICLLDWFGLNVNLFTLLFVHNQHPRSGHVPCFSVIPRGRQACKQDFIFIFIFLHFFLFFSNFNPHRLISPTERRCCSCTACWLLQTERYALKLAPLHYSVSTF